MGFRRQRLMKNNPEALIKRHIVQYLKLQRIFCWVNVQTGIYDPELGIFRKLNGFGMRLGVSDILGIFKGKLICIEVKSKTGRPTAAQIEFLDDVNKHGGIGFIARSVEDVIEKLKDL